MADDEIVSVPGAVAVRNADGRFQRIKTPAGFTDAVFRNAVAATDGAYRAKGALPSVDDCVEFWPKIRQDVYAQLFLTDEFKDALRYRGVEWDENAGLTQEQGFALMKLLDPGDRRSTTSKLKELGIPFARYEAWMKQPLFKQTYLKRSEAMFGDIVPVALMKTMSAVEDGNMRAIELSLAMSGRYDPAAKQVDDMRQVVRAIIESVIRNVPDPKVRESIMSEIALHAGTLQALES